MCCEQRAKKAAQFCWCMPTRWQWIRLIRNRCLRHWRQVAPFSRCIIPLTMI